MDEHVSTRTEPLNLKSFVRELETPVLVGGCSSYQHALHLMRTGAAGVLVGVDGSASSLAALRWAVESLPEDATITAAHYIIPWVSDPLVPVDDSFNPTLLATAESQLAESISSVVSSSSRPDRVVRAHADIGAASWGLSTASRDVDMLAVGHRDRSVLATRLLGSVADHTVRHSAVPVVVVPDPE